MAEERLEVGTYCIFTGKFDHGFPCVVIAYDGDVVVVRRLGGSYVGVKQSSLVPTTREEAMREANIRSESVRSAKFVS